MASKSNIRPAQVEDLAAIVAIEKGCFAEDAFSRRQLRYLITRAQGGCFVAEVKGCVVGYISLLARPRYANVRIYSVAVAPTSRGCGSGQALVEKALSYARECSARSITLEVNVANTPAQALYRKNGFSPTTRLPGYYHDGSDAWQMLRLLD